MLPKTFIRFLVPDLLKNLPVESSSYEITDILKWNGTEERIDERLVYNQTGESVFEKKNSLSWTETK